MFKPIIVAALCATAPCTLPAAEPSADFVEHLSALTNGRTGSPMRLKADEMITTKATFKPPVEILVEAKTDSTNLRLGYAADQLIFNWELAKAQLRIDGGPAGGTAKNGAGLIPINKYVLVRWVLTPKKQSIYVDGQMRFEHSGNYADLDKPVSVFSAHGAVVTVKSLKVKQLPPGTE